MDRLIGKALLEVHSDKQSMARPAMPVMQAVDAKKSDIRARVVFKQEANKKIVNLKELAQSRHTSTLSLRETLNSERTLDFKLKLPQASPTRKASNREKASLKMRFRAQGLPYS